MPIPTSAVPAISQIGMGFADTMNQQFMNRESRQWSEQMYQRQYDDNIKFWTMQNEYNSPEMQMQRLRSAGLNPNLVYGNGSAANTSGPIKSPEIQKPNFDYTPNTAIANAAGNAYQAALMRETRELQNDNLRVQNENMLLDGQIKETLAKSTLTDWERKQFDLDYLRKIESTNIQTTEAKLDQLKAGITQTRTNTDLSIRKDAREAVSLATSVEDAAVRWSESRQRVAQSKDEQQRIRASTKLLMEQIEKEHLENDLRREGLNPNDPAWQRVVMRLLVNVAEGKMEKPSGVSLLKWLMQN